MKILSATWLLTCDENNSIIKNGTIVFDKKIIQIDTLENIKELYPNEEIKILGENSVLMPGLINSHIHLEFSANSVSLKYGNFMAWLNSVMEKRDYLIEKSSFKLLKLKLEKMKKTGTTTIGAISSYSFDLKACLSSPLNTVFFCEVIGSKAEMIDTLFNDFKQRLEEVKKYKTENFIPAIAIHSPYSVHPFLIREVLKIAREESLAVSAHFLESPQEYEWLQEDKGLFMNFFKKYLNQTKAVTKPIEFLEHFKNIKALSFTHCVEASKNDLEMIKTLKASINHCPTSNRLLNNTNLDLEKVKDINLTLGTDGLSSNNSLSMFDELRNALMIHSKQKVQNLAKELLLAATKGGAKALGLNKGSLKKGFDSDIITFNLPDKLEDKEDLAMQIILHTKFVDETIIGGKSV